MKVYKSAERITPLPLTSQLLVSLGCRPLLPFHLTRLRGRINIPGIYSMGVFTSMCV